MNKVNRKKIIDQINRYSMVPVPSVWEQVVRNANPFGVRLTTRYDEFDDPHEADRYAIYLDFCRVGQDLQNAMDAYGTRQATQ